LSHERPSAGEAGFTVGQAHRISIVELSRPLGETGIDPADQILDVRESLLEQKSRRVPASHPVMAVRDDLGVLVQF
jgi:hypothetical protein